MAAELSFLALKTVAAFQDVRQVAQLQAVCKNWCWGMREQATSITSDSICNGTAAGLTKALQSGTCCPDRLVLDVVGRPEEVSEEPVQKLTDFLKSVEQQKWHRKMDIVQEKSNTGHCCAVYTRKSGYSTHWHLENVTSLVEAALQTLPVHLQELNLQLEAFPSRGALSALSSCSHLHTLQIDCHQGTLSLPDVEHLVALGPGLTALSIALPELQKSAVLALVAGLPGLVKLRLERKTPSVCASSLAGLSALKQLEALQLVGYGPVTMMELKELSGLTALELSHACMAVKEHWEVLVTLTGLRQLHLIPAASALMPDPAVACPTPLCLPHLSSLQMLVPGEPHALASLSAASRLRTLNLHMAKQQEDPCLVLEPMGHLSLLRSLTLSGPTLVLNDAMLGMLCCAAQQVTHLAVLGRIGPFGPEGLSALQTSFAGLKHLALGAQHMDQMFVLDTRKELPCNLEVLELCAACIVQDVGCPALPALQLDADDVAVDFGRDQYRSGNRVRGKQHVGLHRCPSKPVIDHKAAAALQLPDGSEAGHVDKMAARSSNASAITTREGAVNGEQGSYWAALRELRLHKCCGVPAGSNAPDSTMRQPVVLNLSSAKHLRTVTLTDCTLADVSVQAVLAGCAVSSLTLAPYENWRGTAAQLTAQGMQAVMSASAAASLRKLELRLTHRMHRDGTDARLVTNVFAGMTQLRCLKVFTEESHWHRLPPMKALGRLRGLQLLHIGAVHERKIPAFIAGLQQVLPPRCRLSVVKYSPDLLEEQ